MTTEVEEAEPTPAEGGWQTVAAKPTKTTRQKKRQTRWPSDPTPVFCQWPVIIDEEDENGRALRSFDWQLADVLREAVCDVRTIRPLGPRRILVGCTSQQQQQQLAGKRQLRTVAIHGRIPTPKV